MKPSQISVSIGIPFVGHIDGVWNPGRVERDAAWELYLELVTRIAVVRLGPDEGKLREALTSLYELFGVTREVLRRHGPAVAVRNETGINLGKLAVAMLNGGIRPLLAHWHPELQSYESTRGEGVDDVTHERAWDRAGQLRAELDRTREMLTDFARLLGQVAGVDSLLPQDLPIRKPTTTAGGVSPNNETG